MCSKYPIFSRSTGIRDNKKEVFTAPNTTLTNSTTISYKVATPCVTPISVSTTKSYRDRSLYNPDVINRDGVVIGRDT